MQFDYDQLRALSAILRTGSFEAAAAQIGVTPSAISQRVKALEEHVGARLVLRGTPCTATELGDRLARHADDVALMEAQLLPERSAPARLSIAVNADSLATWIIPALASQHDLRFDVIVEDQDHSVRLLKEGRVGAAITTRAQPVQGCDSLALGALAYIATASPAFAQRWFQSGVDARALAAAPALKFDRKDGLQTEWAAREAGGPVVLKGHVLPSTQAFVDAACAGMGWGMNPAALVEAPLAQGRLVPIGRDPHLRTPLYWQVARRLAPQLQPLTCALRDAARAALVAPTA